MKTNGADFKAWHASDWGHPEAWWDDYVITINGEDVEDYDVDKLADDDVIEIHGGVIFLGQGLGGQEPKTIKPQTHFRNWKTKQTHERIAVLVEKEAIPAFKQLVAAFKGAKVVS